MRLANISGRAHVNIDGRYLDIAEHSGGRFSADPQAAYATWDELTAWSRGITPDPRDLVDPEPTDFGPPVPRPRQIFAVGLNYAAHSAETGLAGSAEMPLTFTKFVSSIAGPHGDLALPSPSVDWEVEAVAVIGRETTAVEQSQAWDHVAGITVGQDFSDRALQMQGTPPQFSLGKSYPGFAPIGPEVVGVADLLDRDALVLRCAVDGEVVQEGTTAHLIHSIPRLVAMYSQVCTLMPGDLIFTGTPDGVGMGRTPARYLRAGETVETSIDGIGTMRHRCVTSSSTSPTAEGATL